MILENKILIMMMLLQKNGIFLKKKDISDQFFLFFNEKISPIEADAGLQKLISGNLIYAEDKFLKVTENGMETGRKNHIDFYFSEGVLISEESLADGEYKSAKNLGVVNSDSMIDEPQIQYIDKQIEKLDGIIYDLGCGRGELTALFNDKHLSKIIGIDSSDAMISFAREHRPDMFWEHIEMDKLEYALKEVCCFLLIDSIYFIKDKKSLIKKLYDNLIPRGKLVFSYSGYIKEPSKAETLNAEKNLIGKILTELSIPFEYEEFTSNELNLWEHREKLLDSLKSKYKKENHLFLYYDSMNETKSLLNYLKKGLGRRFIYSISKAQN